MNALHLLQNFGVESSGRQGPTNECPTLFSSAVPRRASWIVRGIRGGFGVGAVTGRTGFALIFGLRSSTSDCLVMKSESACAVASPTLSSGMCLATETS